MFINVVKRNGAKDNFVFKKKRGKIIKLIKEG